MSNVRALMPVSFRIASCVPVHSNGAVAPNQARPQSRRTRLHAFVHKLAKVRHQRTHSVGMRCALESSRFGQSSNISGLRALRAAVLRRAVSRLSGSAATLRVRCVAPTQRSAAYSGHRANRQKGQSVRLANQRPNPSVEGTHNGGARLLASSAAAAPLCAPHLKR